MPRSDMKSKTVAASNEVLSKVFYHATTKNAKTVKAFFLVLTDVYWGHMEDIEFNEKSKMYVKVKLSLIAEVLGYTCTSAFTAEVRRIYRTMNKEFFEDYKDEPYFVCDGFTKNKEYALFKITKPKAFYCLSDVGNFTCFDVEDVFRCKNLYDFRVLYLIASSKVTHHKNGYSTKALSLNTYFLKQLIFMMPLFSYCYINKKHEKYSEYLIRGYEDAQWDYFFNRISEAEKKQRLEKIAYETCFQGDVEKMNAALAEMVTFNNRNKIEEYLNHALEIVNQGEAFSVVKNSESGKLFTKKKKAGYRVDTYEITVNQKESRNDE